MAVGGPQIPFRDKKVHPHALREAISRTKNGKNGGVKKGSNLRTQFEGGFWRHQPADPVPAGVYLPLSVQDAVAMPGQVLGVILQTPVLLPTGSKKTPFLSIKPP
jgi:hypothetical protein